MNFKVLIELFGLFVVLSAYEVCGAKSLISSSSPEDLEMNSISSSSSNGGGGTKLGSDIRHGYANNNLVGGAGSSQNNKRYSAQATNSQPQIPPSAYSNLNAGYYGLGGYNAIPSANSYRYNSYMHGGSVNPIIADPYERMARDYNPSTMMNSYSQLTPVSSSYGGGYIEKDSMVPDYMASASSSHGHKHGGSSKGHHHGGYGWMMGHGHQNVENNNTGLGLLGLLGLLSLLQGVLLAFTTTTTTAAAGRKKRDVLIDSKDEIIDPNQLTTLVLPYLNVVAHARQGTISMDCTQRQVCFVNKIIKQKLGENGRIISEKMSEGMKDLLLQRYSSTLASADAVKKSIVNSISIASRDGLADLDCDILYPPCLEMRHENGTIIHPPLLIDQNTVG